MRFSIPRFLLLGTLIGTAVPAHGQTGLSLQDVLNLLSGGVSATRATAIAKEACIAFPMDSAAEAELTRGRVPRELITSLRSTCFTGAILEIVTDPPGVDVTVDRRSVGPSPYRARLASAPSVQVQVGRGDLAQIFDVEVPRSTQVRVSFEMREDTLPLPPERSARQIAEDLGLIRQWIPSIPRPVAPVAPVQRSTGFRSLLFGAVGGAIGVAAASVSPAPCHDKQVAAQDSYVGDKLYRAGTEVDLGVKSACAAGLGVGVGIASSLVSRLWLDGRARGRVRQYEAARDAHPGEVARWDAATERERNTWLASNPQVSAALTKQAADRANIQGINEAIKRRNATRKLPAVVNMPITATTPLRR